MLPKRWESLGKGVLDYACLSWCSLVRDEYIVTRSDADQSLISESSSTSVFSVWRREGVKKFEVGEDSSSTCEQTIFVRC